MLCDNGRLFESDLLNPRQFTVINQATGISSDWIIATPVRYKNYVHILLSDMWIYRFNANTKEIIKLRAVNPK